MPKVPSAIMSVITLFSFVALRILIEFVVALRDSRLTILALESDNALAAALMWFEMLSFKSLKKDSPWYHACYEYYSEKKYPSSNYCCY